MSQSDLEISNQGFPSFRAELNDALEALQTNSSGTSEPPDPEPFQWWYDVNERELKLRNGNNNDWIVVLTLNSNEDAIDSVPGATLGQLGVTATPAEINKLDGVTASTAEINKLDGLTASTADLNAVEGLSTANGPSLVPVGTIVMWSGSIASIPAGWALCNGSNGTPNLVDRFVVAAGSNYGVGNSGGSNNIWLTINNLPPHEHGFSGTTSPSGAHFHDFLHNGSFSPYGYAGPGSPRTIRTDPSPSIVHSLTSTVGNHQHTFSGVTTSRGQGQPFDNRPLYYALAYIMKL